MWKKKNCILLNLHLKIEFLLIVLPKAPWRKSLRSALIIVSFGHMSSKTYSVKCNSGARVIGDFGSQCNSNSEVLYIPARLNSLWSDVKHAFNTKFVLPKKCYLQLSKIVWHFCSSNGNFCKFIQQCRVAWILVEIITVPSGETAVKTSFSDVPKIDEARSLAKNMCGIHKESRNEASPIIGSFRLGATSLNTNRGSTYRSWIKACILNCYKSIRQNKNWLQFKNSRELTWWQTYQIVSF